jgi:hypothetical protein
LGGYIVGRITIYLDSETEKRLTSLIRNGGSSKSQWIVNLIKEKVGTSWPKDVVALAGAWADMATVEEIRGGAGEDVEREPL